MKREGSLIEKIASLENLECAFYKAQKGKYCRSEVIEFRNNLYENLNSLGSQILSGVLEVGHYSSFQIFDPKPRIIYAAEFRERVLHHAIINVCRIRLEKHLIHEVYSNRVGKGQYAALRSAMCNMSMYGYVAKLDVRKYFDSVDHKVLKRLLSRLFKDKRLLQILCKIIDSYNVSVGKGIPIGNLTSQYFANYYLSGLDHYAKEVLKCPGYVRYMDDVLIYDNDYEGIKKKVRDYCQYAKRYLLLEFKPAIIKRTDVFVPFLGYSLKKHVIGLTSRSKRRFIMKYRKCVTMQFEGKCNQREFVNHIRPLFSFVSFSYSKKYRTSVINRQQL